MEKKTKKPYRNAIRSEKMIIHAYAELMQRKGKITVTDIVNEADINRSTFYAHFKSIDDVRKKIHSDVLRKLMSILTRTDIVIGGDFESLKGVVDFLESDENFYKSLIKTRGADEFFRRLRDNVINIYMSDEELMSKIRDKKRFEAALRFFTGGYMGLIIDWANDKLSNITLEEGTIAMSEALSKIKAEYM